MLLIRHALSAFMIPFIDNYRNKIGQVMIFVAEALRVPSLLNAVVVFVIWNLIMAPGIYLTMGTKEKKEQFVILASSLVACCTSTQSL